MAHPEDRSGTQLLLRRLLERVSDGQSVTASVRPEDPQDSGQVILDVVVDGVRYLVLRPAPGSADPCASLSPREREIARMVAQGYPNKIIAGVLEISPWTVGTHLRRIFAKFGVTSRAAMVARLLEGGAPPRPR